MHGFGHYELVPPPCHDDGVSNSYVLYCTILDMSSSLSDDGRRARADRNCRPATDGALDWQASFDWPPLSTHRHFPHNIQTLCVASEEFDPKKRNFEEKRIPLSPERPIRQNEKKSYQIFFFPFSTDGGGVNSVLRFALRISARCLATCASWGGWMELELELKRGRGKQAGGCGAERARAGARRDLKRPGRPEAKKSEPASQPCPGLH